MEGKMDNPFGPFGSTFERLGDILINKVIDDIFGDSDATRLTRVFIYNHTDQSLYFLDSSFETGGFSMGMQPHTIEAQTISGYRVESFGLATGVTKAHVTFGLDPSDNTIAVEIVTSNPYIGDNSASATSPEDLFTVRMSFSVGNANQVDVDVFPKTE
jgi:hypothetical protein